MSNKSCSLAFYALLGLLAQLNQVQAATENIVDEQADKQRCIAPYQFIELTDKDTGSSTDTYGTTSAVLGMYERISPDGRFVLRSFSGRKLGDVALIELPPTDEITRAAVVGAYATPLVNEAFPVQGSWRYLVNPDGAHFVFRDVLTQGKKAKAVFKGGMTGFYAAAAELEESRKDGKVRIRSLSWPQGDGVKSQGKGALTTRTITVDTAQHKVLHGTGRINLCGKRSREDGPMYALPMISVDGLEFSAMPQTPVKGQPTMRVFGFEDAKAGADSDGGCTLHETFHNATGKTIFGFPDAARERASGGKREAHAAQQGDSTNKYGDAASQVQQSDSPAQPFAKRGGDLAFESGGTVYWFNRQFGQDFPLTPPLSLIGENSGEWIPTAFPGITRDGRVIYGATWQDCKTKPCKRRVGYVVADPYQLPGLKEILMRVRMTHLPPPCVTVQAVLEERQRFAKFHHINE